MYAKHLHLISNQRTVVVCLVIGLIAALGPGPSTEARQGAADEPIQYVDGYLWGSPQDIHLSDTVAYVIFSHGLAVYDLSDPSSPVRVGRLGFEGGPGWATSYLQRSRDRLWVNFRLNASYAGGMVCLDVSNPSLPTIVSMNAVPFAPMGIIVIDTIAYVVYRETQADHGLKVLDVSNPSLPQQLGQIETDMEPHGVALQGDRAFLNGYGIATIDVSDPALPTVLNEYRPYSWYHTSRIIPKDTVLLVAEATQMFQAPSALSILKVGPDDSLVETGSVDFVGFISDMHLADDTIYLSIEDSLSAVSVADITAPYEVASIDTWGWATSIELSKGIMITGDIGGARYYFKEANYTDRDLHIYDWSGLQPPIQIGSSRLFAAVVEVVAAGDYAYAVLEAGIGPNLIVVDIGGGIETPIVAEYTVQGEPNNVSLSDSLIFVTGEYGLEVVTIENPSQPEQLRAYPLEPFFRDNTYAAVAAGKYVFVAAYTRGYLVFDLADPTDLPVATISSAGAFGKYLYTNDGRVFDIGDPTSPILAGSYDSGNEVCVDGTILCVGTSSGFKLFEIATDPVNPVHLHTESNLGAKQDTYIEGNNLYVAMSWDGILRYDLSDLAAPVLDGIYDTPGNSVGVFAQDTLVLVADYKAIVMLRADIATDVINPDLPGLPSTFELSHVYPNPFNPGAQVNLSLPSKQSIELTIYNILGQTVRTRVMSLPAGEHTINLQLDDSPSGIYFIRAQSDDFDQTRKMILMK